MAQRTVLHFLKGYLALLLGLIFLLIPLYEVTFSRLEEKQLALNGETLKNGVTLLEEQVASLSSIAQSAGSDSVLNRLAACDPGELTPADYLTIRDYHNQFFRLCLSQTYVRDYGILLANHILFMRERVYIPGNDGYGLFFSAGGLDEQAFYDLFQRPDGVSQFLPSMVVYVSEGTEETSARYRAAFWVCSINTAVTRKQRSVFFASFPLATMAEILMPGMNAEEAGFVLETSGGQEIGRYGYIPETKNGFKKILAEGSGIRAVLFLSDSLFHGMMSSIRNTLILIYSAIALIGFILACILAYRSSLPLHRLLKMINESAFSNESRAESRNDYEYIGNTVTRLNSSIDEYRNRITQQQARVKERAFETMLRETPYTGDRISDQHLKEFRDCFPDFPEKFRLARLRIGESENSDRFSLPSVQIAVRSIAEISLSPAPYVYLNGRSAVLLLDETSATAPWSSQLSRMRTLVREKLKLPMHVVLSETGTSVAQMHMMYKQAGIILHQLKDNDMDDIDVWQQENRNETAESFPIDYTEMSQLHKLLSRAEMNASLDMLRSISGRLKWSTYLEEATADQVFSSVRGVFIRVRLENYSLLKTVEIPDYHGDPFEPDLYSILRDCVKTICTILNNNLKEDRSGYSALILAYVDSNIGNSMLSPSMAAEHFGISEPTLQKAIRSETGHSFFEYVDGKRHEQAVYLLRNTDLAIAEISEKCGYNSLNTFYKAFRRLSPMTPAAIRKEAIMEREREQGRIHPVTETEEFFKKADA